MNRDSGAGLAGRPAPPVRMSPASHSDGPAPAWPPVNASVYSSKWPPLASKVAWNSDVLDCVSSNGGALPVPRTPAADDAVHAAASGSAEIGIKGGLAQQHSGTSAAISGPDKHKRVMRSIFISSPLIRLAVDRLQHHLRGRPRAKADGRHAVAIGRRRAGVLPGAMTGHPLDDVARPLERQEP